MRTLPERVYFKHGAYYYVTPEKQWIRLGKTEEEALSKYADFASASEVLSTMNRVFDKYLLDVVPTKAPRTQQDNKAELKNLRAVFGAMRPMDVKPRHIAQYLSVRSAKIRGNREIALLSHVFKKAVNWGVVEVNPCRDVEKNPEYPRDRYVTEAELKLFVPHTPRWLDSAWDRAWRKIKRAGLSIEHFREHDLRAVAASRSETPQQLLVHSSPSMTATYLRSRAPRKLKPTE